MSTISEISKSLRKTMIPALAVATLVGLLPQAVHARIPIETLQRELQARFYYLAAGNYIVWPECACQPAPLFPPEQFYGDLDHDPELAAELVQDLAYAFFGSDLLAGCRISFYSISGAGDADGIGDDPLYRFWLDTNGDIEGQFDMPNCYSQDAFPISGSDFDLSSVTTANYTNCVRELRGYIERLVYVSSQTGLAGLTCVDTNLTLDCGFGNSTNAPATCDDAKAQAAANWGWTSSPAYSYSEVKTISSSQTNGGVVTYSVSKSAVRSRPYCGPTWVPGSLSLYLAATNCAGYPNLGPTNNWAVTPDGKWHRFWTVLSDGTNTFYGPHIADVNPMIAGDCGGTNGNREGWTLVSYGAPHLGVFAIFRPVLDATADNVPGCGAAAPGVPSNGSCGPNCITPGAVSTDMRGMGVRVNLGPGLYGKSAGYFYFHAGTPSPGLYTPASLRLALRLGSSPQLAPDLSLSQVSTPNVTAYVQANAAGYAILFTDVYAQLVSSVSVSNNANINQMFVTETLGSNGAPRVIEFNYSPASGTWTKKEGNGLRNESRTTAWTTPTNRTDSIILSNNFATPSLQITEEFRAFPWGSTLVQRTSGAGSSAETTGWTYYDDTADTNNYGQLKQVVEPTGRWERYQHDSAGRVTNKVAQFGNNPITSPDNSNRVTQISYNDINGVITTVKKLRGTEVARTYRHQLPPQYSVQEVRTIRCATAGAPINDPGNLTNIVWRTTDGTVTGNAWDTVKELQPDGTMTFYTYVDNAGQKTTIVRTGAPDSGQTDILDGTQTTRVVGLWGETLSSETRDIASGLLLAQETYTYTDDLYRSHTVTHLDGTTEQYNYACCGLDTYIDRDGATAHYTYDAAKRQVATTRLDITTSNVLDAAGNVLKTIRIGTDSSTNLLRQAAYDLAGRMTNQVNALNGVTSYSQGTNASGQTILTITYPNGGTRIETNHQDGSLYGVGGTATHPLQYLYGVDGDGRYTIEIKIAGGGTNEWIKTSTDLLGRSYKTLYASASGTPYSLSSYNTRGQLTNELDPDNVSTLFAYNPKGEQVYSVLHSNINNYSIDFTGTDRIIFTTNDVVNAHSTTVRRSRTYVWGTFGSGVSTLVSTVENSVDGLQSWQIQYRDVNTAVTNHSQTTYGANGTRSVTTTAPDGSYTITTYQYGRLLSVSRYDSTQNPISTTSYGYDPHGRQYTSGDARNGTTTFGFNAADLATSLTTPNPGTPGGSPQTTLTYYNNMLQATNILQPDGTTLTSEYNLAGELKRQYGSRTYPVGYGYDYAGRLNTMTNWSGFPSTGARVTTWNYDSRRGWLTSKTYHGGVAGPSYTYTAAGRLQTRTWARGVTSTYGYNWAGALASVSYSDSTPGVTTAYDRLGRAASTLRNGITNYMVYNTANQLQSESYSGGLLANLSVTNGYDQYLRRTQLAARNSATPFLQNAFAYDTASRLLTVTDNSTNTAYSATYSYLANSPLVSQIEYKQSTTTRMKTTKQYDYLNRLTAIRALNGQQSTINSYEYQLNAANQRIRSSLADGSYWLYTYDSLGQVVAGNKYWADGTPVAGQQFDYTFDTIGNRTVTHAGGDQNGGNLRTASYSANTLNQYTSRTVPGVLDVMGIGFATNAVTVNNQTAYRKGEYYRQQLTVNNASTAVWQSVTNAASGQTSVTGAVFVAKTPENFYYDADGNLTNDGRWRYAWDAENRLVTLTTNTAVGPRQSLKFEYDWKGRRIHKQVWDNANWNGTPTNDVKFVYDGWNLLAELNGTNNTVIRSFMWGSDLSGTMQGAGGVGGLLQVVYKGAQTTNCFVAFDGNGNVAALADAGSGAILAQYEYGPFGEPIRATGPMAKANPLRFSTKYQDEEPDLVVYLRRPYNPSTGRWLSRDLIVENGGLNLYAFLRNDPANSVDPVGLCKCEIYSPLTVYLAPPNNPAIIGRFPVAWGPADSPIWDGTWDQDGDGIPDGDVRIWFIMTAHFSKCCEFRQEKKGRVIVDGRHITQVWGGGLPLSDTTFCDDNYSRTEDPENYHELSDGTILFTDYDNPGVMHPTKTLNLWLAFMGYIIDVCPDSPTYGRKVGDTKYYGWFTSGSIGSLDIKTYGFDAGNPYGINP